MDRVLLLFVDQHHLSGDCHSLESGGHGLSPPVVLACIAVSVPAWEQYNHHYNNNLLGKGTKLVKTGIPTYPGGSADEARGNHHMGKYPGYEFVQTGLDAELGERASAYSNQFLPMGNGAESRRTFHYFPPGYGAQVYSPTEMTLMPMIIDQRNREGKIQDPSGRHGIVPKESNVGPEAMCTLALCSPPLLVFEPVTLLRSLASPLLVLFHTIPLHLVPTD